MKVLLLTSWLEAFYPDLRGRYPDVDFKEVYEAKDVVGEVADAEVVFGYLDADQFEAAKNLKWIQTLDAGVEALLGKAPAVIGSDVIVTNARGAGAPQIGEHAVALVLMFARGLNRFWRLQQDHKWDQDYGLSIVQMVHGKTAGIVGFGRSGVEIGLRCKALGMNVIAIDRHKVGTESVVENVWSLDSLNELLEVSDYVIVTVPMTAETEGMIGTEELARMKSTAYLIVTSRGRLVDHGALVNALREKIIAGAGLDVTVDEPLPPENELWNLENVVITPHIAGNSPELDEWTYRIFEENLEKYLRGQLLKNIVDKQKGY